MSGGPFSVLRLELRPDAAQAHRLEQALRAVGSLERAVHREAARRLQLLRESKAWRAACKATSGEDRGTTLAALRKQAGLSEAALKAYAQQVRRDSVWMCDHLDSQTAGEHGAAVWARFANHLFCGTKPPRLPRAVASSVRGRPRDRGGGATPAKWQSVTLRGRYTAGRFQSGTPRPRSWEAYTGGLAMVWNPRPGRHRELVVPVETGWPAPSGRMSATASRAEYHLANPETWRQCKIVRVARRGRVSFELHLLVEKPPYRAGRYDHRPDATVGIDTGVSSVAAVGVVGDQVTGAALIRLSQEERDQADRGARRLRRLERRADRALRAANPHAYAPDRRGRPGRGSYLPGQKLARPASYRRLRAQMRDLQRRAAETRARRADTIAAAVVGELGANLVVETTDKRPWQRRWGRSLALSAPAAVEAALQREALLAEGSFTRVPSRLGLTRTCHCGAMAPKPLSQRTHTCAACSTAPVDRDLHAAYLAAHVTDTDTGQPFLDVAAAHRGWPGAEQPLSAASRHPYPAGHCWARSTTRNAPAAAAVVFERWSQTNVETPDPAFGGVAYPEHDVAPSVVRGVPDGGRDVDDHLRDTPPAHPAGR